MLQTARRPVGSVGGRCPYKRQQSSERLLLHLLEPVHDIVGTSWLYVVCKRGRFD